jgi:hypothetical protein
LKPKINQRNTASRIRIPKRIIIYISLFSIMFLASSCIYLRLLKFKNQLADFDRYFQVREEKGLKIKCLKPVLYSDDIKTMLAPPTLNATTKQSEQWTYTFEKQYPNDYKSEKGEFDILLDMVFKDDLLNEINLPERFQVIMPKSFLITICKTMGNAEVNKKEYSAKGTYQSNDKSQIQVPKQEEILKFLGDPFIWREKDSDEFLTYKYKLKQQKTGKGDVCAFVWFNLTFQKPNGMLLKAELDLCGIELLLNFVPDAKKEDKK